MGNDAVWYRPPSATILCAVRHHCPYGIQKNYCNNQKDRRAHSASCCAGGIQRYLEAHPESGGHFQGRNFVFDPRCSVGPAGSGKGGHSTTMGRCQGCKVPWDDYTARRRCASCRLLILLCEGCQIKQEHVRKGILCELCAKRQQDRQPVVSDAMEQVSPRRLRILCLHGFRQSASQFRVRVCLVLFTILYRFPWPVHSYLHTRKMYPEEKVV